MASILQQIEKAESLRDFDVKATAAVPAAVLRRETVHQDVLDKRRNFLAATLPESEQATEVLERIILGNELQPISYFERGAIAARSVARIAIRSSAGSGWATGFMISPGVLLTNNHVLPNIDTALSSLVQFEYELDIGDQLTGPISFELVPGRLFHTSADMDFTVVAVSPNSSNSDARIDSYGCLPLIELEGKVFEGEWLTIIQHPNGERKQVCVRENRLIKRAEQRLWYATDTLAGSSGSPVFNNDWYVVALHHSGVPEYRQDKIQTIDGRDFEPGMDETRIKWIANEGIRASRIVKALKAALPDHPLLRPLYAATPQSARITAPLHAARPQSPRTATPLLGSVTLAGALPREARFHPEREQMANPLQFPIDVRVRVEADGTARLVESGIAAEAAFDERVAGRARRSANFDAPFDPDYSKRSGYDPDFLGKKTPVGLPVLGNALKAEAAPLLQNPTDHVLHYWNYSLVMHATRRLAIYSAANVDFANRYDMSRPPDVWRRDPRIKAEHQLENWYYQSNQFDRGHLTRREDLEFGGTRLTALSSAADTCHWTNCTPQHARFNQNKEIWQGIERYVLESTILDPTREIRAQVITGPVLDGGDPDYKNIQYPVQFWKVVVALDDAGKLAATAYLASQAEVIARFGIEAAPFGEFMHFQTTVAEIERLTGLAFVGKPGQSLRDHDPAANRPRPRRTPSGPNESVLVPAGRGDGPYWPIAQLDDIVRGD